MLCFWRRGAKAGDGATEAMSLQPGASVGPVLQRKGQRGSRGKRLSTLETGSLRARVALVARRMYGVKGAAVLVFPAKLTRIASI